MTTPVYQWQPSTAVIAARAGIRPSEVLRFDHNTSPFSPDGAADGAAEVLTGLNEYPAADYQPLREAVADYAGLRPEQVVTGAGADEMILLSAGAFLPHGGLAVSTPPTYSLYAVATAQREADLWEIPRPLPDFELPLDDLLPAVAKADLVWLCVPNNPTGNRDATANLAAVLDAAEGIVVVDAAYAEFAGDRWGPWVERFDNLVVLGTLSKAFGLAGIRVGYSLSAGDLADRLHERRPPGSISSISAALAEQALRRPERVRRTVEALTVERDRLAGRLVALGLEVYPSSTNFLLARVGDAAVEVAERLMWEAGIVVRDFATSGVLSDHLRFTVRTAEQHDRLVDGLQRYMP